MSGAADFRSGDYDAQRELTFLSPLSTSLVVGMNRQGANAATRG
jgi:hypothetical protein